MNIIIDHFHIILAYTPAISQMPKDSLCKWILHSTIKVVCSSAPLSDRYKLIIVFPTDHPSPYVYRLQRSSSTSALTFTCETRTAPPTEITWRRNGVSINIDGNTTRMTQTITNRRSTYYTNTLYIHGDPDEMAGRYTYSYGNRYSSHVTSSSVTIQGI